MEKKLPTHSINLNLNFVLDEMNNVVKEFYPVGQTISNDEFEGYQKLRTAIASKINQLINGNLPAPFDQLVLEVENAFPHNRILKETEKQFPNYALSIELYKREVEDIVIIKDLKLRISLIANLFTIFHQETIVHKGVSSSGHSHFPVITTLVSGRSTTVDQNGSIFVKLREIVESKFLKHRFVNHYILFKSKIQNAVPHGFLNEQYGTEFPLYNFLFDYDFVNPSLNVVVP